MPSITKTVLSTAAAVALVQFCPAPFLAEIPAAIAAGINTASSAVSAAGTVAGSVLQGVNNNNNHNNGANHPHRRQEQNELAWSICHDQLGKASLHFSSPTKGNVLVEGMPPACMTLATVITGQFDVGNPIPMSSSLILFQNLSDKDIRDIQNALDAHHSKL
ncbi:hypothetical protein EKO27_g3074 [Xylaria grammica]|uniref:Uncharacterized protein n=1 Tax=Xylaria grammica TaxID=363999 RepID=A0A439DCB0_9PEZI|nr:hypothetical protein EKO27_g3074 [Xylaria grammica]